ncbi:MAG: hypothetical protein Q9170_002675 [Blastenia crenularia]
MLPPPPKDDPAYNEKRDVPPSDPHAQIVLCTPGTKTFIKLTRTPQGSDFSLEKADRAVQSQISELVGNTWTFIQREHVTGGHKDGVINEGEGWVLQRKSSHGTHILQVANAHHKEYYPKFHFGGVRIVGNEVTWGVLRAALTALGNFMATDVNRWTQCTFQIWDGKNQVGTARISEL